MECACYKGTNPVTFVDNVIRIGKKLLPVEVKLNIRLESNLQGQCTQYCKLDRLILSKKATQSANMKNVIDDKVLVIDIYAVYMFFQSDGRIDPLYDLDNLLSTKEIDELRKRVVKICA